MTDDRIDSESIERNRINRVAYFKQPRQWMQIQDTANKVAYADKSDPFTRSRVLSHYAAGSVMELDGYHVEFRLESRITSTGSHYMVDVPYNQKRP